MDIIQQGLTSPTAGTVVDLNFTIGETSNLYSNGDGFVFAATDGDITSASISLTNDGNIYVNEAVLFANGFDEINFVNAGTISQGSIQSGFTDHLFEDIADGNTTFFNSGTITVLEDNDIINSFVSSSSLFEIVNHGLMSTNGGDAFALGGNALGTVEFLNTGTVYGDFSSGSTVSFDNEGDYFGDVTISGVASLNNLGLIGGAIVIGIFDGDVGNLGFISSGVDLGDGTNSLVNVGEIGGDVLGGSGSDMIWNDGLIFGSVSMGGGSDTYRGTGEVGDTILGEGGNDTITTGDAADDIDAGSENDTVHAGGGDDTVIGGTGNDTLRGGQGDDALDGGDQDDSLRGVAGNDDVLGGEGNDALMGGDGDDVLNGGNSNDELFGMKGEDELIGGSGSDDLHGGMGSDILTGGGGKDDLFGNQGDDVLNGGGAADTLTGGRGNDTLTGGDGPDRFIFSLQNGNDIITDFEDGSDLLDFSAFNIASGADLKTGGTDTAAGYLIDLSTFGGSGSVLIQGITEADIGPADLIL